MSRIISIVLLVLVVLASSLCSSLLAQTAGNRVEELILQQLTEFGDLQWSTYDVQNKEWQALGSFGQEGDSPLIGTWRNSTDTEPAVLRDKLILVRNSTGTISKISLPEVNLQTVVKIADIDRNGISDIITIIKNPTSTPWRIRLNPLTDPKYRTFNSFGAKGDIPVVLNSKGKGNIASLSTYINGRSSRISLCTIPCKVPKLYMLPALPKNIQAIDAMAIPANKDNDQLLVRYATYSFLIDLQTKSAKQVAIDSDTQVVTNRLTRSTNKFAALQDGDSDIITIHPLTFSNEYDRFNAEDFFLINNHSSVKAPFSIKKPTIKPSTATPTSTATSTNSQTATQTFTATATPSPTATNTPLPTETPTPTPTRTTIPTNSPTTTPTPTSTATKTATSTNTQTPTSTSTATRTHTQTATPTNTPSPSFTSTMTPTSTRTATSTATLSPTSTLRATSTATFSPTIQAITITKIELLNGENSQLITTLQNNEDVLLSANVPTVKLRFTIIGVINALHVSLNDSRVFTLNNGITVTPAFALGEGPLKISGTAVDIMGIVQASMIIQTQIVITGLNQYGPALAAHSLTNASIGGASRSVNSLRFRANASGLLRQIQLYWVYKNTPGYHAGDGGIIKVTLRSDDGTSLHLPTSEILSTLIVTPDLPLIDPASKRDLHWARLNFINPASITTGKLYHIFLENIHPDPLNNWISINAMYNWSRNTSILQPVLDTIDFSLLRKGSTGAWTNLGGYAPTFGAYIDTNNDGVIDASQGQSYMEWWSASLSGLKVNGTMRVRQTMRPSSPLRLQQVYISMGKFAGSAPVNVRIMSSAGTVLSTGQIPGATLPLATQPTGCPQGINDYCHHWIDAPLTPNPILQANQTYYLEFSTSAGSDYRFHMIRDGAVTFRFPASGSFTSGNTQFSNDNGNTWSSGVTFWGSANRTDGDLSFYFDSENI